MPSPENLQVLEHSVSYDRDADGRDVQELAEHTLTIGEPDQARPLAEVGVSEAGLVKGDTTYSVIRARRLGRHTFHVIERAVTPPLLDHDEIEKVALAVAEELFV